MPLTALEHELRQRARDRIRDGRLPGEVPSRCWGGHGSNTPCSLCDEVIPPGDVEYEVETVEGGLHRFHFLCHAAWQLECARQDYLSRPGRSQE